MEMLMELPSMNRAEIIAGKQGSSNVVEWSHIIELHDVSKWIRDHTLVIVTGVAFVDLEQDLLHILEDAIRNNAAALLVSLSKYISFIPSSVIHLADKNAFPFITIPGECSFMDITYEVAQKVFAEERETANALYDQEMYAALKERFEEHQLLENESMLQTLKMYIETGGNATSSAKHLYVHLNTMKYRLARLEEMLQCNLRDENTRIILKMIIYSEEN